MQNERRLWKEWKKKRRQRIEISSQAASSARTKERIIVNIVTAAQVVPAQWICTKGGKMKSNKNKTVKQLTKRLTPAQYGAAIKQTNKKRKVRVKGK